MEDLDDSRIQLTITDVPSENYAESCLLSDGAQAIAAILPTEDGVYQLTVAVRSGTQQYVGASQWQFTVGAPPFRDVPQSSDAYEAVKFVYDSGLMEGTGGNRFSPDAAVTRAQAITPDPESPADPSAGGSDNICRDCRKCKSISGHADAWSWFSVIGKPGTVWRYGTDPFDPV